MFIVIAVLLGLIIGLARGGSIGSTFNHLYKKWYLGFAGAAIMIVLHYAFLVQPLISSFEQYLPIFNFIAYILVLLMLIFNLDDIFTILIALGVTLNFIVTFINSGYLPVSDSILSSIPINYTLTQSIYTGMNPIYSLMQPQTLLSFLGVIIPIPFLQSFLAAVGTLPGFSIGDILLIIGIVGALQQSMTLGKREPQIVTLKEEAQRRQQRRHNVQPVTTQKRPGHFESRTEELFFEDSILPQDPLDRIFGDEEEPQTKIIDDLQQISPNGMGGYSSNAKTDGLSVEDLTKPLGTGIINSKEINRKIREQQQKEAYESIPEEDGFFASSYLNGQGRGEIRTEEIFADTNTGEEIQFFTNETEIQTAEIVLDEGEKPLYKPTQEKLQREPVRIVEEAVKAEPVVRKTTKRPQPPVQKVQPKPAEEIIPEAEVITAVEEPVVQKPQENVQAREAQRVKEQVVITPAPAPEPQEEVVEIQQPIEEPVVIPVQKPVQKEIVTTQPVEEAVVIPVEPESVEETEVEVIQEPQVKEPEPLSNKEKVVQEVEVVTEKPLEPEPEIISEVVEAKPKPELVEIPVEETQPVEVSEEVVTETTKEPEAEIVEEVKPTEEPWKPGKKFGIGPGNFLYLSSQLGPTKKFVSEFKEETKEGTGEPTVELSNINDIFFDYDQYQLLLNSIKDAEFREELENTFKNYSTKKYGKNIEVEAVPEVTEVKTEKVETPVVTEAKESVAETVEETKVTSESVKETVKPELKEVYLGGAVSSIGEHDEELIKAKEAQSEEIADIIEAEETPEAPKLRDLLLDEEPIVTEQTEKIEAEAKEEETSETEVKETSVIKTVEEVPEVKEVVPEIEEETQEAEAQMTEETIEEVEPEEVEQESVEEIEEIVEETATEEAPKKEFLPVIDWESFANLILDERELKRGSYVQEKQGGYFVNKAYKEEQSKMDKSEERMMNVWSNLSKENQKRKLERRKQASSGFRSEGERIAPRQKQQKPEVVEVETQEVQEQEPLETASVSETQRINQMSDEEREKAGYEKVTINFQGNEISFWQKKVNE